MKRIVFSLAAILLWVPVAAAQDRPAPGTPLALLSREKVQKELKLTDDQLKTVKGLTADLKKGTVKSADLQARLKKALKPAQLERLQQISYQVRGGQALLDSDVAGTLKLTEKQKDRLAALKDRADKELKMFLSVARFKNAEAMATFIRKHYEKAGQKMLAVLSDAQKKQFTRMQGKAFETSGLDQP